MHSSVDGNEQRIKKTKTQNANEKTFSPAFSGNGTIGGREARRLYKIKSTTKRIWTRNERLPGCNREAMIKKNEKQKNKKQNLQIVTTTKK